MANTDNKRTQTYMIGTLSDEVKISEDILAKETSGLPNETKKRYLKRIERENLLDKKEREYFKSLVDYALSRHDIVRETTVNNIIMIIKSPVKYRESAVQMKVTLKRIYDRLVEMYDKDK